MHHRFKNFCSIFFARLIPGGLILGILHQHQWVLLLTLLVIVILWLYRKYKHVNGHYQSEVAGFMLTALLGTCCELWGTYHQYWTYHSIPANQLIPVWIPVAWGCTYFVFHSFEKCLCSQINNAYLKLACILLVSLILPTVGEYIPIYLHVWTYHWPYQLLGVPLLASLGIFTVHVIIFLMMTVLFKTNIINSPIYNTFFELKASPTK